MAPGNPRHANPAPHLPGPAHPGATLTDTKTLSGICTIQHTRFHSSLRLFQAFLAPESAWWPPARLDTKVAKTGKTPYQNAQHAADERPDRAARIGPFGPPVRLTTNRVMLP